MPAGIHGCGYEALRSCLWYMVYALIVVVLKFAESHASHVRGELRVRD